MKESQVAIIGGGLSGTYLATLLQNKGIAYTLFEAKAALGGRILSPTLGESLDVGFDLGPTWFWSHQYRIKNLLESLLIPYFEQYTQGDVLYQLDTQRPVQRSSGAAVLPSFRIRGGMQTLINSLQNQINNESIQLSTAVTAIKKLDGHWHITVKTHSEEKVMTAKHIVFAVPPRILLKTINIEPSLPKGLMSHLSNTPTWMAAQAKFVAVYKSPFWRDDHLAGEVFSRVGPLVEIHDASAVEGQSSDNTYALFGFLGMPVHARKKMPDEAIKNFCVQQLAAIFGDKAKDTLAVFIKDWAQDNWVSTERDNNESPAHPQFNLTAYKSVLDEMALSFSSTEYADVEAGYLEGALVAAESTAAELVDKIKV